MRVTVRIGSRSSGFGAAPPVRVAGCGPSHRPNLYTRASACVHEKKKEKKQEGTKETVIRTIWAIVRRQDGTERSDTRDYLQSAGVLFFTS